MSTTTRHPDALTARDVKINEIAGRAVAGDANAFAELMDFMHVEMVGYAAGMLKDQELARDACSALSEKLMPKFARGTVEVRDVHAFIMQSLRNLCLDMIRHQRVLEIEPWQVEIHDSHVPDNRDEDVLMRLVRDEEIRSVRQVMARMPPRARMALSLYEYEGLSCEQIGQALDMSRTAAKSALDRARKDFRRIYLGMNRGQRPFVSALIACLMTVTLLVMPGTVEADERPTQRWRGLIERAADEHGIDADLLEAIVLVESNGNPNAVSPAGAIGLGQLLPQTARSHGVDPWNPADNLRGAAAHLSYWLQRCGYVNGIAAYNGGTLACAGRWRAETAAYVPRILHARDVISSERHAGVQNTPASVLPTLPRAGAGGAHTERTSTYARSPVDPTPEHRSWASRWVCAVRPE